MVEMSKKLQKRYTIIQAWSIIGMYQSSPIFLLMNHFRLLPAHILLDSWQQAYTLQILDLPDFILTKNILPITLWIEDENA